jgi:excisionase family DNA binding protein
MELEYYTVNEIASKLRVDTETVYRWLWNKKLNGVKVGDIWRIPIDEYQKFTKIHN